MVMWYDPDASDDEDYEEDTAAVGADRNASDATASARKDAGRSRVCARRVES